MMLTARLLASITIAAGLAADAARTEALSQASTADTGEYSGAAYAPELFFEQVGSIPLEVFGAYGGTAALGFSEWGWGTSSFKFRSE